MLLNLADGDIRQSDLAAITPDASRQRNRCVSEHNNRKGGRAFASDARQTGTPFVGLRPSADPPGGKPASHQYRGGFAVNPRDAGENDRFQPPNGTSRTQDRASQHLAGLRPYHGGLTANPRRLGTNCKHQPYSYNTGGRQFCQTEIRERYAFFQKLITGSAWTTAKP